MSAERGGRDTSRIQLGTVLMLKKKKKTDVFIADA